MKRIKSINILIISLVLLFLQVGVSADIWMRQVNSNRCYQLLVNENELWGRMEYGGLVRWDLKTRQYARYYDTRGLQSSNIQDMVYDNEGRLIILESNNTFLRFENGTFKQAANAKNSANFCFADGYILTGNNSYDNKGISKWDGENWIDIPEFDGLNIYCIIGDPIGGFWADVANPSTYENALVYYKDGEINKAFTSEQVRGNTDFNRDIITSNMTFDEDGIIWACVHGGIAWYDGNTWQQHYWDIDWGDWKPAYTTSITKDKDGTLWAADGYKGAGDLWRFDGSTWNIVTDYIKAGVLYVKSNPAGGVFVATLSSLELYKNQERERFYIDNLLPIDNNLQVLDISPDGDLWCGSSSFGEFAILHLDSWISFRGKKMYGDESLGTLWDLKASNSSGVWVAFSGNLLRYDNTKWIAYRDEIYSKIGDEYYAISEAPDGSIWVGTSSMSSNPGIARWNSDAWEFFYPKLRNESLQFKGTQDITLDADGNPWIAAHDSLWFYEKDKWYAFDKSNYPILQLPSGFSIQFDSVKSMSDGTVWVGGRGGIAVISGKDIIKVFTKDDGLPYYPDSVDQETIVTSIKQAPDGNIWVLTYQALALYTGSGFKSYEKNAFGIITGGNKLEIDSSGKLFILNSNYNGGLTEFTPTSVTLKMSLFADQIAYKAGDKLNISLMVNNYGPDETGDLYFVMLAPDGKLYSGLDWSQGVRPAASNFTIPADYSLPLTKLLNLTLPSTTPPISQPGKYYFMIALADHGTTYLRSKAIVTIDVQ